MGVKMKRRYKLLIIILIGVIATIIINSLSTTKKTTITALGDGLSLGMTPYNVAGNSFNDYLKEKIESVNDLDEYNNEFSIAHLTIHELHEYIDENVLGRFTRTPIKQTLAKSDIITIAIGIDELADKSLVEDINLELMEKYLKEMEGILSSIREFYEKDIIIIGLYPAYNFTKKDAITLNSKLKVLCGKYDANFFDIIAIALNQNYYLETNSYYFNYQAHEKISSSLYKMYKK